MFRRQLEIARQLAAHQDARVLVAPEPLLSHEPLLGDPDVDYKAAWALGQIGDARAITPLIEALDHGNALMCVYAIHAREALDATDALPTLQGMLGVQALPSAGPRLPVGDTAKAAIRRLTREP